jgi:hypothetical protein
MQRYYATIAYNLYYLESIGYTLSATRFLINKCKIMQIPVICSTLNKMGIDRNVYRHIVFGPKHTVVMALRHLHTLQGMSRIQYLIGHITNDDGVSKLMCICIEAIQLEVLLFSLHGYTLISRSWINEIWSCNELFFFTIMIANTWLPHPQRDSDQTIMSLAVNHVIVENFEIHWLKYRYNLLFQSLLHSIPGSKGENRLFPTMTLRC